MWKLEKVRKRRKMEGFKLQSLCNVVKEDGPNLVTNFENKFKEIRIEGKRKYYNSSSYVEKLPAIYTARQVEILIFGDYRRKMKVRLFTDSEATLESIASCKQIDRKALRMTVVALKEKLVDGEIYSYSWLPTEKM